MTFKRAKSDLFLGRRNRLHARNGFPAQCNQQRFTVLLHFLLHMAAFGFKFIDENGLHAVPPKSMFNPKRIVVWSEGNTIILNHIHLQSEDQLLNAPVNTIKSTPTW